MPNSLDFKYSKNPNIKEDQRHYFPGSNSEFQNSNVNEKPIIHNSWSFSLISQEKQVQLLYGHKKKHK